jgi:hypothetical protein
MARCITTLIASGSEGFAARHWIARLCKFVIANPSTLRQDQDRLSSGQAAVKQSMTSEGLDRHGLRPRDDANNTVIARNVVTWQSMCGIGPDTGGSK